VTANDAGDPDPGANDLQNFPVLTSVLQVGGATQITGMLNSTPNTTFALDFFANTTCDGSGYGEGQSFLGSTNVTTNGSGNGLFIAPGLAAAATNKLFSATATSPGSNTSEFSACRPFGLPGATVTPTSGLVTTEAGGTATFTVRLNSVPTAPVTIPIASSDTTEGTISPASLLFAADQTALNPQTVTVTGQSDAVSDGDVGYTIVLGVAASADLGYIGVNPPDVSVTNLDGATVTCSPRPNVTVTAANNNDGRLKVTVAATTSQPGAQNRLVQLQFGVPQNANVQIPGQPTQTKAFNYAVPGQPTSFVFYVGRQQAGLAATLPITVIDGCPAQPWKTFVGGGPAAF
jgi:hypothetical protein